ncbi:hypothetical protein [Gandjariella thermophila]|uniref:Integral membrane protein n=1 Tax=Gandjariella thermophila TaxID=1931992 RepID=A0A4D4JAH6_9PSEU|nr:hypothetical protein [Gandjariella thermophila]GDY33671.1 hypothetical protein GTS_53040 [Gandjariella thermophila]
MRAGPPLEIRVAALLIGAASLLFLLVGAVRWVREGGADILTVPVVAAALQLPVAAGLLIGVRASRIAGMVVVALAALLDLVIALGEGPWWTRVVAGALAATHGYVFVLLNTAPARQYLGGTR